MKHLTTYLFESVTTTPLSEVIKSLDWSSPYKSRTTDKQEKILCDYYDLDRCSLSVIFGQRYKSNKHISLDFIRSQGGGRATKFLKDLCQFASENAIALYVKPTALYVGEDNLERLKKLYYKFGFTDTRSDLMIRSYKQPFKNEI